MRATSRRSITRRLALAALALATAPLFAQAPAYPDRPVRVVIPYAAGGGTDILMRYLMNRIEQSEGLRVLIDNRPGATGAIGAREVARARSDGYTLLAGHIAPNAINPGDFTDPKFPPDWPLVEVALAAEAPSLLLVQNDLNVGSVAELKKWLRSQKNPTYGSGVRPDRTNVDLIYHNDNAFNHTMPEYVGLLCLNPAKSGGVSRVMSFHTAHNALLADHADALPRLYQPFWIDRQKEHDAADTPFISKPMFEYDGEQLRARLCLHQVKNGYAMRGESLDDRTQAAILALEEVFEREALTLHFTMERGQLQYCNNLETGHSRTEFVDFDEPAQKRHLVRIWLRDRGLRAYRG